MLFVQHDTKSMERVCALLSKMLSAGSCGATLQCHIITALTCLLLELSVATRQQRLFEGFVEVMLRAHSDPFLFCLSSRRPSSNTSVFDCIAYTDNRIVIIIVAVI